MYTKTNMVFQTEKSSFNEFYIFQKLMYLQMTDLHKVIIFR